MKFCKDCTHYRDAVISLKCYVEAACMSANGKAVGEFDPVTGQEFRYSGRPRELRADPGACGANARWFEPANLDGRLAMLEDAPVTAQADSDGGECD